jgi:hypothetical protein
MALAELKRGVVLSRLAAGSQGEKGRVPCSKSFEIPVREALK